ncbi:hypothetical protein [Pacificibacter marinus]|uniref:hypothetical protein n=1 Tax=Pacificibacter marinus TaxID=658057 RepID=UPI001113A4F1|nr:hypothetical protein [Pacificibacter marinus]
MIAVFVVDLVTLDVSGGLFGYVWPLSAVPFGVVPRSVVYRGFVVAHISVAACMCSFDGVAVAAGAAFCFVGVAPGEA